MKKKRMKTVGKYKKVMIALSGAVILTFLGFGMYQASASQADPELSPEAIKQMVNDQYPGEITEMELEKELNKVVYEVEVYNDGKEFELKLDGNTGEVLKLKEKFNQDKDEIDEVEIREKNEEQKDEQEENDKSQQENENSNKQSTVIEINKAIDIALNEFSGTVTALELDEDDGRLIYEIEVKTKSEEAEIEIDAYTGEVLVMEIDD